MSSARKQNRRQVARNCLMTMPRLTCCLLIVGVMMLPAMAFGQATSITSMGYRCNEGGGGAVTGAWVTGNLGNMWTEGEWVAYQLVIDNVQTDYPNLAGFPDIVMSYDFTNGSPGSKARFVDLVRSIQAGTQQLTDLQGYPKDDGSPYATGAATDAEQFAAIDSAQNDIGNTVPLENYWQLGGGGNFALLNLPNSQVNLNSALNQSTDPCEAEHNFYITKQDLIDAGIPLTANKIVIYYQLHESRTFLWYNELYPAYDQPPTDDWGGYLYSTISYDPSAIQACNGGVPLLGAGYVPGSSGHIEVEFGGGAKTVPIPIPETLPGTVSGVKWSDVNGNCIIDPGEPFISGWEICVSGTLENIFFETCDTTDVNGIYDFPNLTSGGSGWTICETGGRTIPVETDWMQTCPTLATADVGVGTPTSCSDPDDGAVGWLVNLTVDVPDQPDMNFGNKQCIIECTAPPDVDIDCTDSTDPSFTGYPTVTATCPPVDTVYSDQVIDGNCPQNYTIIRTWTVTDVSGNQSTCIQTINVSDTTAPTITCAPVTSPVECPGTPSFDPPTVSDDCDPNPTVTFADVTTPGSCPQEYSVTRTWTATDACGNSASCSQTIDVVDTTAPVITCATQVTPVECPGEPSFLPPTVTDDCDPNPTVTFSDETIPGSCPQEYSVTRTWTATDACGNSSSCSRTIDVIDTTAPVITCATQVSPVECPGEPSFVPPTVTDDCDPNPTVTFTDVTTPGNCPQEYSVTRTWTATDACGNSSSCSRTIDVVDTQAPEITCAPVTSPVECPGTPSFDPPTVSDLCDPNPTVTFSDETIPGNCPQEYAVVRTWTATDACGNSATCSQRVEVVDTQAPEIICAAQVSPVECPGEPSFIPPTVSDLCDPNPTVTFTDVTIPGRCPQEYSVTRTWTATDACGNSASCSRTIDVIDTQAPEITCAPVVSPVECPGVPSFDPPTVNDLCDPNPTVTFSDETIPGNCPQEYAVVRTWTATDACGNSATCSQRVEVVDTQAPEIVCATQVSPVECPGEPSFIPPTVSDLCDPNPTVTFSDETTPGRCPQEYSVTRTWTATDACGNSASCSRTIEVVDTQAPEITCAPVTSPVECPGVPSFDPPTVNDLCDPNPTVTFSDETIPGNCPQEYAVVRTWTATDACGNSATCSQRIEVIDTTPPEISCPADFAVQCIEDVPPCDPADAPARDACGPVTVTCTQGALVGGPCGGTVTNTYTATDDCGNTASCTQVITVNDTQDPTITCPPGADLECPERPPTPASNLAEFLGIGGTASDNCGDPVVTWQGDESDGQVCPETITRTYRATDQCGNYVECTQVFVISDSEPPQISCPPDQNLECPNEPPAPATNYAEFVGQGGSASPQTDPCSNPIITWEGDESDGQTCPETITRTYRATDACGNYVECTQTFTIDDTQAPSLTCPADVDLECPDEPPAAATNLEEFLALGNGAAASDECGDPVVTWEGDESDGETCPETITRTYRATDACGNYTECTQLFTIDDTQAPEITCPADEEVDCRSQPGDPATDLASFLVLGGTASDACGDPVITWEGDESDGETCPETVTRTYRATDACGNYTECTQTFVIACCVDEYCSFTQGYYGNAGGYKNGESTLEIIQRLITPEDTLVVGKPGRSVSFPDGTEECVIELLPSGGAAKALPNFGDQIIGAVNHCQTDPEMQTLHDGVRIKNVLFGQTVALSLNVRYDNYLCDLALCKVLVTQKALCVDDTCGNADDIPDPGPDGINGTADDPIVVRYISQQVLDALDALGLDQTVCGLLELANRALAGQPTGGASLSYIAGAAGAINEAFDECRFLIFCGDEWVFQFSGTSGSLAKMVPGSFELEQNYPNPFNPETQISYAITTDAQVELAVFNVLGQRIRTLVSEPQSPNKYTVIWNGRDDHGNEVATGVYFYRLQVNNNATSRKMLMLK